MSGGGVAAGSYLERLAARVRARGTSLCVGIDPDVSRLPRRMAPGLRGVEELALLLVTAAAPHAAAVKVNLAFFEALGSPGLAVLERVRARLSSEVVFLADAKRGDIGSTSAHHATALYDVLGADAVTLSPYLGRDAIEPLLSRTDRFAYVLCRTSNPGAGEFQDLLVASGPRDFVAPGSGEAADAPAAAPAEPLYLRVARRVSQWQIEGANCGLVVGATAAPEIASVRDLCPGLPFLVPGIGAQGGDLDAVRASGPATAGAAAQAPGGGLLVNVSRGIAETAMDARDPAAALDQAAAHWAAQLRV